MNKHPLLKWPRIRIEWGETPDTSIPPTQATETADAPLPTETAVPSEAEPKPDKKSKIRAPRPRRAIWKRIIFIGPGGVFNLILWCVIAGLVMRFTGLSPWSGPPSASAAADNMWNRALEAAGWAVRMGWKPALTGATVILPVWISWRVITLPFRR